MSHAFWHLFFQRIFHVHEGWVIVKGNFMKFYYHQVIAKSCFSFFVLITVDRKVKSQITPS